MEGDENEASSREGLLSYFRAEGSGHYCSNLVKLSKVVLLFGHGVSCLLISAKLKNTQIHKLTYQIAFSPAYISCLVSLLLLMSSWFVSIPYVRFCFKERVTRGKGPRSPSVLTDVLPDIAFALLGFIFVGLLVTTESFLGLAFEEGIDKHKTSLSIFMTLSCCLLLLHALLFKGRSSGPYCLMALDGIITYVLWTCGRTISTEWKDAVMVLPTLIASFLMIGCGHYDFIKTNHVLTPGERWAKKIDQVILNILCVVIGAVFVMAIRTPASARIYDGTASTGIAIILFSIHRFYFYILEIRHGSIESRLRESPPPEKVVRRRGSNGDGGGSSSSICPPAEKGGGHHQPWISVGARTKERQPSLPRGGTEVVSTPKIMGGTRGWAHPTQMSAREPFLGKG